MFKVLFFKGRLFDAFKRDKAEHRGKSEDDSYKEPKFYLPYENNLLHFLFSNCGVNFTSKIVHSANGLYPL